MKTSSYRHTKLRPDALSRLRKGVCENHQYDNPDTGEVGDCPECVSGKIQAVNVQRLSDFKCDVCGGRLTPVKTPPPTKIVLFVVGGLILLGTLVMYLVWRPIPDILVEKIIVSKTEYTLKIGDSTKIIAKVIPSEATDTTLVWATTNPDIISVSDGLIKAISEGPATITVWSNDGNTSTSISINVAQNKPESPVETKLVPPRNIHLKDALFSGSLTNGYPHGHGVLMFRQRRRIDNHDKKGRIADVGDYIQGEWNNGHLLMGHWFGQDNIEKEFINIGGVLDPESDHPLYR